MKIDANTALGREIFAMRQQTMEKIAGKAAVVEAAAAKNETKVISDAHRAIGKVDALPEQDADIERIREIGMSAYVEEEKAKKIKKIRESILKTMGLTEEMLAKLPQEQRDQIEKIIAMEIQKQMSAGGADKDDDKKKNDGIATNPIQQSKTNLRIEVINRITDIGPGIGVLLALQEAETVKEANDSPEKGAKNTLNKSDEE